MAPGRLKKSQSDSTSTKVRHTYLNIKDCKGACGKPAMNCVYTEKHLHACRTRQGLTDGKYLLILSFISEVFRFAWKSAVYRWFVDPL